MPVLSEAPIFVTASQETSQDCLSQGLILVGLRDCIYLHTFTSCYLRISIPNTPNLGMEIFLWTLKLLFKAIKNTIGCMDKHKILRNDKKLGQG